MPTGTSMILGVFQAILALLVKWDKLALGVKLLRKEKFASEIFCHFPARFYVAAQKEFTASCDSPSNQSGINGFRIVAASGHRPRFEPPWRGPGCGTCKVMRVP
jgi:hypothetical protein